MPEYLSPGVYVEEFESGPRPMSGVSTSVPGFLGLTRRGPASGLPQFISSMAEFNRKYGGYLLYKDFKEYRYLCYAVEQFFMNGGSRCYVMRVLPEDSHEASIALPAIPLKAVPESAFTVMAYGLKNPLDIKLSSVAPVTSADIDSAVKDERNHRTFTAKKDLKFTPGDTAVVLGCKGDQTTAVCVTIKTSAGKSVTFANELPASMLEGFDDKSTTLKLVKFSFDITVTQGDVSERQSKAAINANSKYLYGNDRAGLGYITIDADEDKLTELIKSEQGLSSWLSGGNASFELKLAFKSIPTAFTFSSKDKGSWGNSIKLEFEPDNGTKLAVDSYSAETGSLILKKSNVSFNPGDVVEMVLSIDKSTETVYNVVKQYGEGVLTLQNEVKCTLGKNFTLESLFLCGVKMTVSYDGIEEQYGALSFNPNSADFIEKRLMASELISVTADYALIGQSGAAEVRHPFNILFPGMLKTAACLTGGSDGSVDNITGRFLGGGDVPGERTGLAAFADNDVISILCAPGVTDKKIQSDITAHCENLKSRFAILDMPRDTKSVASMLEFRDNIDSDYAAMYHPWILVYDPLEKTNSIIPPSGSIAGIYARSDQETGVHKAPANEIVKGAMGLDCVYSQAEQSALNPRGVNLIRSFQGMGIRVWGARTCSSNTLWKYVNVRRLFIYLEESIKANTNWVVFEPNDEMLWLRVQNTISVFLNEVWRSGALAGSSPEEAYYVNIGRDTMTQSDIDNGRLICVIGVAPVKPAEFVIFRLTQKTAG